MNFFRKIWEIDPFPTTWENEKVREKERVAAQVVHTSVALCILKLLIYRHANIL